MKKNKFLYSLIIIMTFFFALLSGNSTIYIFFIFVILMPCISLFFTYLSFHLCKKNISFATELQSDNITTKELVTFTLMLNNKSKVSFPYIKVIELINDKKIESKSNNETINLLAKNIGYYNIDLSPKYSGYYTIGTTHIRIYELLGILSFKNKIDSKHQLSVLPKIRNMTEILEEQIRLLSEDNYGKSFEEDYSMITGLKPYVQSENLKHVHWAASARMNKFISKEYETLINHQYLVIIDNTIGSFAQKDKQYELIEIFLELTLSVSIVLLEKQIYMDMRFQTEENKISTNHISKVDDLYNTIIATDFYNGKQDLNSYFFEEDFYNKIIVFSINKPDIINKNRIDKHITSDNFVFYSAQADGNSNTMFFFVNES